MNDHQPPTYQPQPAPKRRRRWPWITAVIILALIIIGAVQGGGKSSPSAAASHGSTSSQPAAAPSSQPTPAASSSQPAAPAAPTVTRTTTRIVFTVAGDAPEGASIQYGSDNDTRSPNGTSGPLGDATLLPFKASIRYQPDAAYWSVSAQLQGSGNITAKVYRETIDHLSDGTTRRHLHRIAIAHAEGGYNIALAEAVNGL